MSRPHSTTSRRSPPSTHREWRLSSAGATVEIAGVSLAFGGQVALADVGLAAAAGELVGVAGPNGAGKTSLLNCISGIYAPQTGSILIDGVDIVSCGADGRVRFGIARTFQHMQLLDTFTCIDNVLVGRYPLMSGGLLACAVRLGRVARQEREHGEHARAALAACGIEELAERRVEELPYGQRKLVDVARALASEPQLILLDEPMAGLNAHERDAMATLILELRERGVTQLLVEHDVEIFRRICDKLVVLDYGRVLASGDTESTLATPSVREAYLGIAPDHAQAVLR